MKKCEACGEEGGMPRDTKQFLCEDCENGVGTLYCGYCDSVVLEYKMEWSNSQPLCPECGARMEL